ncbi:MAG: hypothetical protein II821_05060 [Treponema sp.]|nr:hypothetical protein [Treponema sp.]
MKKFCLFFVSFFLVLVLNSCSDFFSDSSAALKIRLPEANPSSRAAADSSDSPSWISEVAFFTVTVKRTDRNDSGKALSQTGEPGKEVSFQNIEGGIYAVEVIAKKSSGETAGIGSKENVAVKNGENTRVTILIKKYDGSKSGETEPDNPPVEPAEPVTYDGNVSFNGADYETLQAALLAAKENPLTSDTEKNTITFNGNIKETLLATENSLNSQDNPWYVTQNLVLNLNGNTLFWDEAAEGSEENPLFVIASGKTLVIKNGTITSSKDITHTNCFIQNDDGSTTLVLEDLTIKNITASSSSPLIESQNSAKLFMKNVTIKDCKTLDSLAPVSVGGSEFYALNTKIQNVLGTSASVYLNGSHDAVSGAFVGGEISLSSTESLSDAQDVDSRDNALWVSGSNVSFFVSSSTVYSNTSSHGIPVCLISGASLNLSDGFKFKTFDCDSFAVVDKTPQSSDYISVTDLGFEKQANVIAAAQTSEVTKSSSSTEYALSIAYDSVLYTGGESEIYGIIKMNLNSSDKTASAIAITGELKSNTDFNIDFGENIEEYASLRNNSPVYWAAGSAKEDDSQENYESMEAAVQKLKVYNNDSYEIIEMERTVVDAGDASGNSIYCPYPKS